MPKVKLNQSKLTRLLRGVCTIPELSIYLGCCYNTAAAKMQDPTRLTVADLLKLKQVLPLTGKEIFDAIGLGETK